MYYNRKIRDWDIFLHFYSFFLFFFFFVRLFINLPYLRAKQYLHYMFDLSPEFISLGNLNEIPKLLYCCQEDSIGIHIRHGVGDSTRKPKLHNLFSATLNKLICFFHSDCSASSWMSFDVATFVYIRNTGTNTGQCIYDKDTTFVFF
jgi:hypothetical protein